MSAEGLTGSGGGQAQERGSLRNSYEVAETDFVAGPGPQWLGVTLVRCVWNE